jgi:UV DNA damage repair endonuclease
MVCHISDQREGARLGSHSDYIDTIPDYFLNIPEIYGVGVDIEVEAKKKEHAIMRLIKKYGSYIGCL